MILKMYVKLQNQFSEVTTNDEGEVASWLILAAGLAAAGVAASSSMRSLIGELADKVRSDAGAGAGSAGGG